jgi:hypothetical protein
MSYYEVIKRQLQRRPIRECRYDKKELKLRDLHVSDTLGVYANWLRYVARSTDVKTFLLRPSKGLFFGCGGAELLQ